MGTLTKVMIIRHAEKPTEKDVAPFGVTKDGVENFESLLVRGWQRAGALVTLFSPSNGRFVNPNLATPAIIYASAAGEGSKSNRPLQTVTPLAAKLGVPVNKSFGKGNEKGLVDNVLKQTGIVLVSWQHEKIPDIALHLVKSAPPQPPVPTDWPDDRFDVVWIFTPPNGTAANNQRWAFVQVPQMLLPGDSPQSQPGTAQ
jgi:hypothetical protein